MEIKEFQSQINQIGICQGRLTQPPGNQLQWFPGEKWINEFKIAQDLGYDFIEILAERNHNPENPIWSNKGQEQIIEISKKNNIKMFSACLDYVIDNSIFNGNTLADEIVSYTKNFLNCCKKVGVNFVVLPLLEKSNLTQETIELVKKFLDIVTLESSKLGITISIESIASPEIILNLLSSKEKEILGCVYDTGNRALTTKNMSNEIRSLSKHINHIHLKDKDNNNNNIIIGTGMVNFVDVFNTLKEINYLGCFSFESNRGNYVYETARHNLSFINFIMKEVEFSD